MKLKDSSKENKIPLVVIASPTASGKTDLALDLARKFGGEILNADSLQVYRYLDIGTAKPSSDQRKAVPHHLLDVVDPDEEYNAAIYSDEARKIIETLAGKNKPVFVVGGTGLYIRALESGMIETPPVDETLRAYYKELGRQHGREYLYRLLEQRDPLSAARLHQNDAVRIIRALEVLDQSGQSIVSLQEKHAFAESPYDVLKIGLCVDREELKKRISLRTQTMVASGLLDEVRGLLERGYAETLKPLQSLGYRQMIDFIRGRSDWEGTLNRINRDTWQYAKRQMTWFGADKAMVWHDPGQRQTLEDALWVFWEKFK